LKKSAQERTSKKGSFDFVEIEQAQQTQRPTRAAKKAKKYNIYK